MTTRIFDAEIVDDGDGELTPLIPADIILTPCHHGCTCGLHQQIVYGERVAEHDPDRSSTTARWPCWSRPPATPPAC